MTPTVFLFDIDGTILKGGGAGRRAMEAAFSKVIGDTESLRQVRFAGMTDRSIVRTGLVNAGSFEDEGLIDAVLDEYLNLLPAQIESAQDYGPHAGVAEAIDAAAAVDGSALGLGTGNIEPGARTKLGPLGFNERFAFGGFGSDAEDRRELLRIGADRGAERLGTAVAQCRVVVVGDTPNDVEAAQAIGAACLAVATGTYPLPELESARPTLAVASLTDPAALSFLQSAT